ncbi:hypothetical protein BI364_04825 [Acidihalobacter yilgarnensis]|uniref:Uncharacterized protein n=1 Tax=Acidihalobacter yilgarnensis TaxID=2819280 RepID=A0A1D8ILS0_9GAMM|nr:hypothetical protein BI364_04825 [Acidihalobacter yilgarnensis]
MFGLVKQAVHEIDEAPGFVLGEGVGGAHADADGDERADGRGFVGYFPRCDQADAASGDGLCRVGVRFRQ